MSFLKAKVLRFNEISDKDATPSPADYNLHLKCNSSGGTIPKSGRFVDQNPASSEISFVSNSNGQQITTPNPPKVIRHPLSRKPKPEILFQSTDDEVLKEKIVECTNKDLYIKELTEKIDEMKQELNCLKNKISQLVQDKNVLESTIEQQIKYKNKHEIVTGKLIEMTEILEQMKINNTTIKTENETNLINLLNNMETLKTLLNNLKKVQKNELENIVTEMKEFHQKEIQQLESDMLKTVSNMHNLIDEEKTNAEVRLNECKKMKEKEISNLKVKYQLLHDDFEAKVKQLSENHKEASILSEILMKEKCEDIERGWKIKLEEIEAKAEASLRDYQSIVESNAIDNEIEKNKLLSDLTQQKKELELMQNINQKIKIDFELLQIEYKNLCAELSKIIIELNNTREEHSKEIQERDITVNQALHDKHLYELTIQKTHKTIDALKKRLMKSDHDVEQLKAELEPTEESKLEVEGKCNRLVDELEIVTSLYDVIEEKHELAVKEAERRILDVEEKLLCKVNFFKEQADEKIKETLENYEKTKKELNTVTDHLYKQEAINTKAQECLAISQSEIERLELLANEYSSKILTLESSCSDLEEQLISTKLQNAVIDENSTLKTVIELMQASENDLLNQLNDLKQQLKKTDVGLPNHNLNEMAQKLELLETENVKLRKTIQQQDGLIGPFRSCLQDYEKEYTMLLSEKENAEKEAKEIALKYAEILGHQNHKQKIKYMVDLKSQNIKLTDDKKQLEHKIRVQARLIEKLKTEKTTPKKKSQKNKENVGNASLNSSRVDSPGRLRRLN
ncbi:hypothetical protein RN001_008705 [Aquatica leii]|uniref:Hyaluronan-mediated motility receptor C-terminal domain-containing protein n=1 Tax=Aquatica leii TaxID=1421715 RepID=A0AAN7SHD5_9COLE|nr:hypothetical protein RN001_008705 [Aquatica leii]